MTKNNWYDKFAPFYNLGTLGDYFYKRPRRIAIEQLNLSAYSKVADVFCGTGVDFELLNQKTGIGGHIIAVDASEGMLNKARKKSRELNINESNISFLQTDLSTTEGIQKFCTIIKESQLDSIFFSLGLTCLPNWSEFTSAVFDAVEPGTRLVIMDVYSENLSIGARFINWIGAADSQRPVWKQLELKCQSFSFQEFRPFIILDVSVIVASGVKPDVK